MTERIKNKQKQNPFMVAQRAIQRHYLNKKDNYTEKDVQIVRVAFIKIGLPVSLSEIFCQFLLRKIEKRNEKMEKEAEKRKFDLPRNTLTQNKKELLSRKEYNKTYKQIKELYDIEKHEVIRELTLPQIIYLVSLMERIALPEQEMIKCIKNIYHRDLCAY